jgi:hypothetical protein
MGANGAVIAGRGTYGAAGHLGVRQSPFATFTGYRAKSEGGES